MKIVNRKIKDLIGAEYNPRELTKDQYKQLKDSLLRFGVVDPVIVNKHPDRDNIIIGGHQRSKVWEDMGNDKIPTVELSLTLDKEKELNVRLNKNTGQFDMDMLANHFDTSDLIEWGFSEGELVGFDEVDLEAEEDDFDVPDGGIETDIVLGDLFEIGEHRLLCGDSTDSDTVAKLMNGKKADMVFIDPPYGVSYKSNWNSKDREQFEEIKNDDVFLDILPSIILLSKENIHWYIWTAHQVYTVWREMFEEYYKSTIIWSKKSGAMGDLQGDYVMNYEMALFCHYGRKELNGKRESAVWDITRDSGIDYNHPTQKPVLLADKAINKSSVKNDLVVDLFLGSGSTMVAAHQLNRKCYGMELDPKYCQVIVDRMMKLDDKLVVKLNDKPYEKELVSL